MFKALLLSILLWFPIITVAQIQDDYYKHLSNVYVTAQTDKEEAVGLAKELFDFVEREVELQTYPNYYALHLVFTDQAPDEDMAKICKTKAEAVLQKQIGAATTAAQQQQQARTGDENVVLEWTNNYFPALFKNEDPKNATKALRYLSQHPQLQDFNNFTYLAYAFERNGDFLSATKYYAKAMALVQNDEATFHPYSFHANFLSRSGKYLEADELIRRIEFLATNATEMFQVSYFAESLTTRSVYYLNIGDYLNYHKATGRMYDYFDQLNQGATCDFNKSSRLTTSAHAFEMLNSYDSALVYWQNRDINYKLEIDCQNQQYGNTNMLMLSMLPIYKVKVGKGGEVNDLAQYIKEAERYYDSFEEYGNLNTRHMKAVHMAYLGSKTYHQQFDNVLNEVKITRDFTESTLPHSNYAYFTMRDKVFAKSKNTYRELFKLNIDWINDLIFTFGEKAFVTYYNSKLKIGYDNFHSFVKVSQEQHHELYPTLSAQAYDNLLLTKSIGFKSTRKRKRSFLKSNDDNIVKLYNNWLLKKQQLIQSYQQSQSSQTNQSQAIINKDSLEFLQKEVQSMENELAVKANGFQKYLKVEEPKWQQVRNKLKTNEAAIEIIRFDWRDQVYYSDTSYYAAYIIKKNSTHPEVVYLPSLADDLENKHYNLYRNAIRLRIDDSNSYNEYWRPIKEHLKDIDKIYFSADGIYHMINMSTLKNPSTNEYLLDEIEVQQVTTTAISLVQGEGKANTPILIGRPAYDIEAGKGGSETQVSRSFVANFRSAEVVDLPGTEDEIVAIEQQMKLLSIEPNIYLAAQATEQVMYELQSPDILHIATHGYWSKVDYAATEGFRTFNAMVNSGLLLAGVTNYYQQDKLGLGNDGILTAYEAQNLDLEGTDLVVLSACETGLGHFDAGEGVYGLQRAFRAAGANSVMTSLWKVDDTATKEFMISFYENYLTTSDKNGAFRKAQLELKDKYSEPYFWGAFVMTGE